VCRRQCQWRVLSVAPNFHAERSSRQTAGDLNISNCTIQNTFRLHTRRIGLLVARPNVLKWLSVVNSTVTMIQSKTWMRFPTSITLNRAQTRSLNHRRLLPLWWKHTSAQVRHRAITLLRRRNATLTVASGRTYITIPTTCLPHMKSTTISSVGSRRRAWRRTMTMCWRKETPLWVAQASKMGIASRSSWLACPMMRLSGRRNCTLPRIWDGMTIPNAQSTTGVGTSSIPWDGWCGSQPTPSFLITPLGVTLTAIRHRHASIPKFILWTGDGRRRYGEISDSDDALTVDESMLRLGDSPIPFIFMSDGTHLWKFAANTNEWPGYMTIGNQSLKIRQMPSMHSVVMVALLPIPIRNGNIRQKRLDEQRETTWEVLDEVLQRVLQPLTFKRSPSAESRQYDVLCADGTIRRCKPVLTAWLADCPEYSDLHDFERHVRCWYEHWKNELGDYVAPDIQHPRQDQNLYRTLSDAGTKAAHAELSSRRVHRAFTVFHHYPCIVSNLPKPDLLHTILIGMLDHLQRWI